MTQHKLPAATSRVFFAGRSGSGKTTLAYHLYLSKFPRVIVLDMTGEWDGRVDRMTFTPHEAINAIRDLAGRSGKWSVSVSISERELPVLVDWLIPVPNVRASPILAVGGAAMLVDEVDLLAPPGTSKEAVRTLYRRSRHVGLTVISTTQRPANVSREVSAQSTHAVALTLNEPRDVEYMTDVMGWTKRDVTEWQRWTRQNPHGGQWRNLQTGETRLVTESKTLVPLSGRATQLNLTGDDDDA